MARQLRKEINITSDEDVLGHNRDRISELGENFQTAAGDLQFPFDWLIAIGDAANRDDLRLPFARGQFFAEKPGSILFDHDFRLEIQPGGKTKIFMKRPLIAIDAPMLTAAVRIDAGFKPDIRTVIVGDDGGGRVLEEVGAGQRVPIWIPIRIRFEVNLFEAIGRVAAGAASGNGIANWHIESLTQGRENANR